MVVRFFLFFFFFFFRLRVHGILSFIVKTKYEMFLESYRQLRENSLNT